MIDKKSKVDFFANGLCVHCHVVETELLEYLQFHEESELWWKNRDEQLQEKIDNIIENYPKEHRDEIIESHSWELHQNQDKFPNIHRESLVITIYNFVESELNLLCEIISESINIKVKLKDLYGKGIERALSYLLKVAEFDMQNMGGELSYIRKVNKLRNTIVHRGGILPENNDHVLNQFVLQNHNLSGQPGENVSLNSEFIGELIDKLLIFFNKLDSEVQEFIKRVDAT